MRVYLEKFYGNFCDRNNSPTIQLKVSEDMLKNSTN